jgi:hypothetical protein
MGCMGYPYLFDFCISEHVSHDSPCMEAAGKRGASMNWQGWVFMLGAWTFIGILFFYTIYRILFGDKKRKKGL